MYEEAVSKAIAEMEGSDNHTAPDDQLKKVVLCRVQTMRLGVNDWCSLAALRRWKYGGHEEGGHLFWMQPGGASATAAAAAPSRNMHDVLPSLLSSSMKKKKKNIWQLGVPLFLGYHNYQILLL